MTEKINLDSVISLIYPEHPMNEDYGYLTRKVLIMYEDFEDEVLNILDHNFRAGNYEVLNRLHGHYMDVLRAYKKHATKDSDYKSTKEFLKSL